MAHTTALRTAALLLAGTVFLAGCGSDNDDKRKPSPAEPGETREHDSRTFTVDQTTLPFDANSGAVPSVLEPNEAVQTAKRYWGIYQGIQGPAAYRVEIPENWNGGMILWARGYGGDGHTLTGVLPSMVFRNVALAAGYAWASSSYSANYYDVRAALEDTNKLALEFRDYLKRDWNVEDLPEPTQYLIAGGSMGGHTAAVAVEAETLERARYQVQYEGALALCQSEQNEFNWLGDYTLVAQHLAGFGDRPSTDFQELLPQILGRLFVAVEGENAWVTTEQGDKLKEIARHLTGGHRPIFDEGFRVGALQWAVLSTGGSDGTINGILAKPFYDNTDRVYRWTDDTDPTAEEVEFNATIERKSADQEAANPVRNDGVRWLPLVQGKFNVPVLTMHTLGDFYVPFRHQQLYRLRAIENGSDQWLVQRAIRAPSHCDFSASEMATALTDFLAWVNLGSKPEGDEVLDPAVVANPAYGCKFTNNLGSTGREALPACPPN